jgi:hypothetical protein
MIAASELRLQAEFDAFHELSEQPVEESLLPHSTELDWRRSWQGSWWSFRLTIQIDVISQLVLLNFIAHFRNDR